MTDIILICAGYIVGINLLAIGLTIYDKNAAKKGVWRIKENTLFTVSILGGSVAMLVTMHKIRHKTKHSKFMVGIPVIIALQVAVICYFINQ